MNSTQSQLADLLPPGLVLGESLAVEPGSIMHQYGYDIYPVGPDRAGSNAVVIDLYGDSTEATHILHPDMTLDVRVIDGEGEVVIVSPDGHRRIHTLSKELGSISLFPGETYRYLRAGLGRLAILDTATPPYLPGYEMSFEEVGPEDGLQPGAHLMLWSPREPREPHRAGVWHLHVGEHHDTTARNRARAGIRGFRGEPSHHHAEIIPHGAGEPLPVNVRLVDGSYRIDRRRLPGEAALNLALPPIDIQPHTTVFKRIGTDALI